MAATSDYFRVMFSGPMVESTEQHVDLKGLTAESLDTIINFMYKGQISLNMDNLTEILNGACHLQVHSAIQVCADYMNSLLTFDSADELLHIADTYSLHQVLTRFDNLVLRHFDLFSQTERLQTLGVAELVRYISSDQLQLKKESDLIGYLKPWLQHDPERCALHLLDVLSHVRFGLMPQEALRMLMVDPLFQGSPPAQNYLQEALHFHCEANENGHPKLTERTKVRSSLESLVVIHHGSSFRPFEITAYNQENGQFYQLLGDVSVSHDCRVATVDNFAYMCRVVDFGGGALMNSLCRFDPRHLAVHELQPMRVFRTDFSVIAFEGKIYVFGGASGFRVLDTVECYTVKSNSWETLQPLPIQTHSSGICLLGNKIYLSGGVSTEDRQPMGTLMSYDPARQAWDTSLPSMKYCRRLHEMASVRETIFVLGGISQHGIHSQSQIPVEGYNITTQQWTLLGPTLSGRSVGHYIAMSGRLFSIGHEHYEATEDEIWSFDSDADVWSKFAQAPRRTGLASALCTLLQVNFHDERISSKVITEKR